MLEWVLKLVEVLVSDRNPQGLEACHGFRELLLWIGRKFSTELLLAYSRAAKPSYEMIECLRFIIYKQHKNSTSSRTFDQAKAIKNEFSTNGNDIILIWYIAILFSIPVKVILYYVMIFSFMHRKSRMFQRMFTHSMICALTVDFFNGLNSVLFSFLLFLIGRFKILQSWK